ncbi:MAG: hypothetical protein H5T66_00915 [Chloroflexi bacterium]|nr:hypothetical protein [Chloroflexota bacterium]
MDAALITAILDFGNLILASANVIIGFSLFLYILLFNSRSAVARAFCALEAFITLVYIVDVGMTEIDTPVAASIWLRLQWLGIAFVPAAYLHFSDALLRTTVGVSRWRRAGVFLTYALGLTAFGLVMSSDVIVKGLAVHDHLFYLEPGPFFGVFATYYALVSLGGWVNITRARAVALTSASRRRLSYLMLAVIAPTLGVFPYLLIPTAARYLGAPIIKVFTLAGNLGIALMTIVIAYVVAYQGVILPDRVVKHRLIHFLLRGPLVAILVIVLMLTIPRVESILGLPRDTVLIVSVAGSVVLLQVLVNAAKPAIDRIIYRRDRHEITWIQDLEQRLLTTTDVMQLLENTVVALCDLMRSPAGFIVTMHDATLALRVTTGPREAASRFLEQTSVEDLLRQLANSRQDEFISNQDFVLADGHWLLPLRSRNENATLGVLGVWATGPILELDEADLEIVYGLVRRAERALEDMRLQERIFGLLQGLGNELEEIQQFRSRPPYGGRHVTESAEANPVDSPGFIQVVKDALSQFWGGPKLSQSPLLKMKIVSERLGQNDNVPAKAVRAVLQEAIERLKPEGERSMVAAEWMIYNILDLRFVRGQRIRDVARSLAMSESDFYRKQRIAIEQLAETLAEMERSRR